MTKGRLEVKPINFPLYYKSIIYQKIFRLLFSIRKQFENSRVSEFIRVACYKWLEKKYGNILYYEAEIYEKKILFSTEDYYSKGWFLTRYKEGKIHEEVVTLFLLSELKSSRCFVDVGTNLGWYSIIICRDSPDSNDRLSLFSRAGNCVFN